MIRRPRVGDTDEDLLRQEQEFLRDNRTTPAATLVSAKRKTNEEKTGDDDQAGQAKPQSKFARERANKKKKEGIVDNTVLKEAASREERVAVLGRVVERRVTHDNTQWTPRPSPHGFPKPLKMSNLGKAPSSSERSKKSLYMLEMERKGLVKEPQPMDTQELMTISDPRVAALGEHSLILHDTSSEAEKIHQENMSKIASMSHEERLREQQELMASLSPEHLAFLKSLRERKAKAQSQTVEGGKTKGEADGVLPGTSGDGKGGGDAEKKVRFTQDEEMRDAEESVTGDAECPESELPIPPSEAKKWLHMDKVDMEKLKWMTNMPKPKPLRNNEGFVARFNFEGDILPYDADISYREGLHHHGEEPGRAGYTIDELFILIRSSVVQQRHIGLRTLANVLRNAREGLYDQAVNPPIIHLVVEAGVVLLLRFALDESSQLVYGEALRGLHCLVACEPDEQCLALATPWTPAGLHPGYSSTIHANDKSRQELDQEEAELKDVEVVKLDVVRALIRMDLPTRIRYILETAKPGPDAVLQALGILTRLARHSLAAAWKLLHTPRLLQVVLDNFLPHNLSPLLTGENVAAMSSVYGVPLKQALTFVRVLAAKGRQIAAILVNQHDVMGRILTYVALEPSEVGMPLQEALMLSQEAYATWATLLTYGLTKAAEGVSTFYPMFVKQLVFYRDRVPVNQDVDKNKFNYDVGAHLLDTLTKAVNVAASHSLLNNRMKLNQGTVIGASGKAEVLQPPIIAWEDLNDVPQLVETCLNKWLTQLARCEKTTFSALRLIGACCSFLDSYYVKWKDQSSYSGEVCTQKINSIHKDVISPFLKSSAFRVLISGIASHSNLACDLEPGTSRDPVNLGSLGCVTHGGKVVPVIQPTSPMPLLLPLTSLLLTLHTLHPYLEVDSVEFLNSDEVVKYFHQVCESRQLLSGQWLTRIETYLVANLLQIAACKGCAHKRLFHEVAMCLITCVRKGDEHLIEKLLRSVICTTEFTSDLLEMTAQVDSLAVSDYEPLRSPAIVQPTFSIRQLTENICNSLPSICSELVNTLATKREYDSSLVLYNGIHFAINGITINQAEDPMALGRCWPLQPIVHVFKASRAPPVNKHQDTTGDSSDQSAPEDILTVTRCLQMAYLGLRHRKHTLRTADINAWLHHLSLVFLVASDMFLDAGVSSYLQGCIIELLRNGGYGKLDPSLPPVGFNSGLAWYRELVQHFIAVSYGDSTFALFLLIPLQQYWPADYRIQLWGDLSDALQFFRLTTPQVEQFIPIKQYLEPAEKDEGLVIKYRAGIGSQDVTAARQSFLYTVATHHIKHYSSQ